VLPLELFRACLVAKRFVAKYLQYAALPRQLRRALLGPQATGGAMCACDGGAPWRSRSTRAQFAREARSLNPLQ